MSTVRPAVHALVVLLLLAACARSAAAADAPGASASPSMAVGAVKAAEPVPVLLPANPQLGVPAPAAVTPSAMPRRPLTPLMADIRVVMDRESEQLAGLEAERAKAPDAQAALEVQRRIEKLKQQTEIDLLRVQAVHARRAGKTALAQRIDAAIVELTQPRPRFEPVDRPAPADAAR